MTTLEFSFILGLIVGLLAMFIIMTIIKPKCFGTILIDRKGIKDVWQISFDNEPVDVYKEKSIVLKVDTNADLSQKQQSL